MIGLDTNILLRYLFNDDPKQSPIARGVMLSLNEERPGWISFTTVLELAWVMGSRNRVPREGIASVLEGLVANDVLIVENSKVLIRAIQQYRSTRADFADCVNAESARAAGCGKTLTFDAIAARDLGMEMAGVPESAA